MRKRPVCGWADCAQRDCQLVLALHEADTLERRYFCSPEHLVSWLARLHLVTEAQRTGPPPDVRHLGCIDGLIFARVQEFFRTLRALRLPDQVRAVAEALKPNRR